MSDKKQYVFWESREGGKEKRIEKTIEELTPYDKKLILGSLINHWENTPSEVQGEFMQLMIDEFTKRKFTKCSKCDISILKGETCPICRF